MIVRELGNSLVLLIHNTPYPCDPTTSSRPISYGGLNVPTVNFHCQLDGSENRHGIIAPSISRRVFTSRFHGVWTGGQGPTLNQKGETS